MHLQSGAALNCHYRSVTGSFRAASPFWVTMGPLAVHPRWVRFGMRADVWDEQGEHAVALGS